MSFWVHVGWSGAAVMLSLGVAGVFIYITNLYTKDFKRGISNGYGYLWLALLYMLWFLRIVARGKI